MGIIVSVTNQKGGVGKTVTVSSLAAGLSMKGFKVLSIDLDPQRNLDMVGGENMAIPVGDVKTKSVLNVMRGECSFSDMIVPCDFGDLARASNMLSQWTGRHLLSRTEYEELSMDDAYKLMSERYKSGWGADDHKVLKYELSKVRNNYDFILMDTNPSLTLLTINSLFAADYVLIPAFAEAASRDAIRELWDTIRGLKKYNPEMKIRVAGILITKFSNRNPVAKGYAKYYEKLAASMGGVVFTQKIRQGVSVTEYLTSQMNLLKYDPNGNPSQDYINFTDEFIHRIESMEEERKHGESR